MRRRAIATMACLAFVGGSAGGAMAAQETEGYNPVPGAPPGILGTAQTAAPTQANVSSLPFTGADLIVVAGASLVLLSLGLALRRTSSGG